MSSKMHPRSRRAKAKRAQKRAAVAASVILVGAIPAEASGQAVPPGDAPNTPPPASQATQPPSAPPSGVQPAPPSSDPGAPPSQPAPPPPPPQESGITASLFDDIGGTLGVGVHRDPQTNHLMLDTTYGAGGGKGASVTVGGLAPIKGGFVKGQVSGAIGPASASASSGVSGLGEPNPTLTNKGDVSAGGAQLGSVSSSENPTRGRGVPCRPAVPCWEVPRRPVPRFLARAVLLAANRPARGPAPRGASPAAAPTAST